MYELLEKKFTRKDGYRILLASAMVPLLIIFMPQIQSEFTELPDNSKNFLGASGAAGVGILLFFLKKHVEKKDDGLTDPQKKKESKQQIFSIELFELFMFMMMPVLAFFGVIPEWIKQYPILIIIIFLTAVGFWYFPSFHFIYKRYDSDDGKIVKTHINLFGLNLFVIGIGFMVLIMFLESLPKIDP